MTTLALSVSVKAGCFWRRLLTHLDLNTSFLLGKFSQMREWGWRRVCYYTGVCPQRCLFTFNVWHHHQSPCFPAWHVSMFEGHRKPSGNQSVRRIRPTKPGGSHHFIMVVWLTNTLFVVEGVYKTSIADHTQPPSEAQQAGDHRNSSGYRLIVYWFNKLFVFAFASRLCIIIMTALCFDEVRETMLSRSQSAATTKPTTRTCPIIMVTIVTWRNPSSTADAREASVRLNEC